jgi:enediyne biosynthesis protein CalE5
VTPTPDDRRRHVHGRWGAVAGAWDRHADFVDARHAIVTQRMLATTRPRPGDHVLELASAGGGVGLAAAPLVAPGGEVVLSDVVPEMTASAAARAAARGLANVTTKVLDLEGIDEPEASFDVVLCRDGLQFAVDPAHAAREIRRVLRPSGCLAVAVWAEREHNPWLGVVFDAVSAELGRPIPPPGMPTPFSLGDSERLVALVDDAGFDDVVIEVIPVPLRAPSFDAWWSMTTALAGPLAAVLASLPEATVAALRTRACEAAVPYTTRSGLEFPGVALLASAHAG